MLPFWLQFASEDPELKLAPDGILTVKAIVLVAASGPKFWMVTGNVAVPPCAMEETPVMLMAISVVPSPSLVSVEELQPASFISLFPSPSLSTPSLHWVVPVLELEEEDELELEELEEDDEELEETEETEETEELEVEETKEAEEAEETEETEDVLVAVELELELVEPVTSTCPLSL